MSKRREFRKSVAGEIVKRASARRHDGQPNCEKCGAVGLKLEVHHIKEDALELDKSKPLTAEQGLLVCKPCHDEMTKPFLTVIAKVKRIEARHLGVTRPKGTIKSAGFGRKARTHEGRPSLPPNPLYKDA